MTLEEYLKDFTDEDKINISFDNKDHYRYRVGKIRTKHTHLLKYEVARVAKKFVYIVLASGQEQEQKGYY